MGDDDPALDIYGTPASTADQTSPQHEWKIMTNQNSDTAHPKFELGQIVATPGCLAVLEESGQSPNEFLKRHVQGDWGDLCEEDKQLNGEAVKDGSRILSAYHTTKGIKLWVITEAEDDQGHRSATTLLLPEEY